MELTVFEDRRISSNIDWFQGKFTFVRPRKEDESATSFTVLVKDGSLDLKFFDAGGSDENWVVNRLSIERSDDG
jgi:hypothetical protein